MEQDIHRIMGMSKNIDTIIGAGKLYEPPFRISYSNRFKEHVLQDNKGAIVLAQSQLWLNYPIMRRIMFEHLCDLLNKEHCKPQEIKYEPKSYDNEEMQNFKQFKEK